MPIPFRDHGDVDDLGLAGYLRFVDEGAGGLRGALFLVNGRGEPVEFCFSRVDVPASSLWRASEARRQAVRALCLPLFTACPREPLLLLARAEEVPPPVFAEDLEVLVPLCRVADGAAAAHAASEWAEELNDALHVFWVAAPPAPDSPVRVLLDALRGRGLMLEPFERAARGIDEAFASM
ncbi:MAG: hypothetical protein M3Q23_00950 [Actinomycetota bacterium]|nr:hypothetical protein [Actinomycetota bacterium]